MSRDFQLPGRSPVIACDGMAATSHPLATSAALDILREGGTAADAAVAACATLCVVEPHMTGIGGDCYALVSKPGKPVWGYNGSGRAGATASDDALRAQGLTEIGSSIHAVTVPGALDAWDAILKTHGRFELGRLLERAIHYAENGWPVAARVAWDWKRFVGKLANDEGATKHYLFNGQPPNQGDVIKSLALGQTLRTIGAKGARTFYEGELADDMAATLKAKGSFLTADDFAAHRGDDVTPISTQYRGLDLVEIPPNGQGIVALIMLNILENFDMKSLDPFSAERFHLQIEAARIGYAIRDAHLADLAHMRVKVADLIDKGFAKKLAAQIDISKRAEFADVPTPGSDTIYLTVVDKDRTAVSFINSLYSGFGLGVCTEKSGIMLTNRGACFTLKPDHANTFGPNKRPMHTIIPGMTMKDGRCDMSFGVMGGEYQPMGHVQIVLNMLDYGMDVQQAIDFPRFMIEGGKVLIEHGTPQPTLDGLQARGHVVADAALPWGGAQSIKIDWQRGVLMAGSDPRKDGLALGY